MTRRAPSDASRRAVAAPTPLLDPVTMATQFCKSFTLTLPFELFCECRKLTQRCLKARFAGRAPASNLGIFGVAIGFLMVTIRNTFRDRIYPKIATIPRLLNAPAQLSPGTNLHTHYWRVKTIETTSYGPYRNFWHSAHESSQNVRAETGLKLIRRQN